MTLVDLRNLIDGLRRKLSQADVGVTQNDVWLVWHGGQPSVAVRCRPGFALAVSKELKQHEVPLSCRIKEMAP